MSTRWPPIVGVVGFDGGHKPAISLALNPLEPSDADEFDVNANTPAACCYPDGTCDVLLPSECLATGGQPQNPGTTCDDVSCTGACCNGDVCTPDTTQSDCEDGGGRFLGIGSVCGTPNPCQVCCSTPTLVCDQISASESKCGFHTFSDSCPQVYPNNAYYLDENCTYDRVGLHRVTDWSWTIGNPCTLSHVDSGVDPGSAGPFGCDCGANTGPCIPPLLTHAGGSVTVTPTTATITRDPGGPNDTTTTATLSSEYTTAMLISNTEAALPSYSDCFGCDFESCTYPEGENCVCLSSRDLSDDESHYAISRFKYKFTWDDPLPSDCTICWIERTYDSDGNPVSDNQMCETVLEGATESNVYELLEPADNGTAGVVFPIGTCCTDGSCSTTDEATCESGGGDYMGDLCVFDGDACDPDPC